MIPEHEEIAQGLIDGNFHRGGITIVDLGTSPVPVARLREDVERLLAEHPFSDVGAGGHVTNWTKPSGDVRQWSLKNTHGNTAETGEDFDYRLTGKRILPGFPAIQELASGIPDLVNMRLNYLGAGSALTPHEEHVCLSLDSSSFALRARFHIPILTSQDAKLYADGAWYRATAGRLYLFNNGCIHAAQNGGEGPRVHLVFDVKMTEQAFEWLVPLYAKKRTVRAAKRETFGEFVPSPGMSETEVSRRELRYWS